MYVDLDSVCGFVDSFRAGDLEKAKILAVNMLSRNGIDPEDSCVLPQFCDPPCISYNDTEWGEIFGVLAERLQVAGVNEAFGHLIPHFVHLLHCWVKGPDCCCNGKTCCQSECEGSEESSSGS